MGVPEPEREHAVCPLQGTVDAPAGDGLAQAHVTAVATDPEQGGRVYAATMNEVLWSDDSGESWNRFDTRLPPRTFNVLAATRTGMVYAGSSNGGGVVQLRTPASAPRP